MIPGMSVKDLKQNKGSFLFINDRVVPYPVDAVIAGSGILPGVELTQSAGLQVDNGILVDEMLPTNHPDIFAAGNVAESYQTLFAQRLRLEHEDNTNMMCKQAVRDMAGVNESYRHLPYFYSDLFEPGYETAGELDSRVETIVDRGSHFSIKV